MRIGVAELDGQVLFLWSEVGCAGSYPRVTLVVVNVDGVESYGGQQ